MHARHERLGIHDLGFPDRDEARPGGMRRLVQRDEDLPAASVYQAQQRSLIEVPQRPPRQ